MTFPEVLVDDTWMIQISRSVSLDEYMILFSFFKYITWFIIYIYISLLWFSWYICSFYGVFIHEMDTKL